MALTRDQILQAISLPIEAVEIEGLGAVNIRTLSVADKEKWERQFCDKNGTANVHRSPNMKASLVALCLVGDSGEQLFTVDEVATKFPTQIGDRLFVACAKVQGDEKDAQELLEKNSAAAPVA